MDINKLEINIDKGNVATALGFSDAEAIKYLSRVLKPMLSEDRINIAECIDKIYNNQKEPFGLRILGVYSLGRMIEERASRGMAMGIPEGIPPEIRRVVEAMEKEMRKIEEEQQ